MWEAHKDPSERYGYTPAEPPGTGEWPAEVTLWRTFKDSTTWRTCNLSGEVVPGTWSPEADTAQVVIDNLQADGFHL